MLRIFNFEVMCLTALAFPKKTATFQLFRHEWLFYPWGKSRDVNFNSNKTSSQSQKKIMHEYNTTALFPSFFLTAYPPWVMGGWNITQMTLVKRWITPRTGRQVLNCGRNCSTWRELTHPQGEDINSDRINMDSVANIYLLSHINFVVAKLHCLNFKISQHTCL